MREIKFRAYFKEEKYMMNNIHTIYDTLGRGQRETEILYNNRLGSSFGDFLKDCAGNLENLELMQYTGLKDKNRVEIYEGDYYKDCDGQIIKVVWHRNGFKGLYTYRRKSQGEYYTGTTHLNLTETSCKRFGVEVIGNIFENPELLEVESIE